MLELGEEWREQSPLQEDISASPGELLSLCLFHTKVGEAKGKEALPVNE